MSGDQSLAARLDDEFIKLMIQELSGQSTKSPDTHLSGTWKERDQASEALKDERISLELARGRQNERRHRRAAEPERESSAPATDKLEWPFPGKTEDQQAQLGDTPIVPFEVKKGKPVAPGTQPSRVRGKEPNRSRMVLLIAEPNQTERAIPVGDKPLIIGRGQDSDVVLTDTGVSRHHLRVELYKDSLMVEDLKSRNGTTINDRPIQGQEAFPGDIVRIGRTIIRIHEAGK